MSIDPNFGSTLEKRLLALRIPNLPIGGCTEDEIKQVMQSQNVTFLPDAYLQFLRHLGMGAGILFLGSSYSCEWLKKAKGLKKGLAEQLSEEVDFILPQNAFVYYDDGIATGWFYVTEGDDDPIVYDYAYGLEEFKIKELGKFSDVHIQALNFIEQKRNRDK